LELLVFRSLSLPFCFMQTVYLRLLENLLGTKEKPTSAPGEVGHTEEPEIYNT